MGVKHQINGKLYELKRYINSIRYDVIDNNRAFEYAKHDVMKALELIYEILMSEG